MGKIIVVTGGARSGKSQFAEECFDQSARILYLAANAAPQDDEMKKRVSLHQANRPAHWQTYEGFIDLPEKMAAGCFEGYLLDCATMFTTNTFYRLLQERFGADYEWMEKQFFKMTEDQKQDLESEILQEWHKILIRAKSLPSMTVIVTNEVGLGIVPENPLSRWFRDVLGRVNQFLGKEGDEVYLIVAGIPVKIK